MKKLIFIFILLVAIVLRFYMLSAVPPSASLDEATIGWNAYSLLHTGHDEYGYTFPLLLRAYDDYRPALYVYLVIPFVKFLGLQVLSVRLPAVIMSILTVAMSFFLAKNLFNTVKKKESIAFATMLLLAISPWHIYTSRLGHEVNLGLTLTVGGLLLFSYFLTKKKSTFLITSFICFALSFYSYQSEKVFTPLLLVGLGIIFWKELFAAKKTLVISLVLFIIVSLPIFFVSLSPGALLRLKGTSVFTDNPAYIQSATNILNAKRKGDIVGQLINNRRIVTGEIFIKNYLTHFNPMWLFGNSGNEIFKAPNTGLLYIWEAPFLFIGLLLLCISKNISKKVKFLFAWWIIVDFVAPGLTTQAPHAFRSYTLLPLPEIIISFGLITTVGFLQKLSKGIGLAVALLLAVVALQGLYSFIYSYFVLFPYAQSQSFQYALGNAITYAAQNKNLYKRIYITNRNNGYQSYMLYLYYTQYDPIKYARMGGTKSGGFQETHSIDNVTFQTIDKSAGIKDELYISNSKRVNTSVKAVFRNLDGSIALYAWTINQPK